MCGLLRALLRSATCSLLVALCVYCGSAPARADDPTAAYDFGSVIGGPIEQNGLDVTNIPGLLQASWQIDPTQHVIDLTLSNDSSIWKLGKFAFNTDPSITGMEIVSESPNIKFTSIANGANLTNMGKFQWLLTSTDSDNFSLNRDSTATIVLKYTGSSTRPDLGITEDVSKGPHGGFDAGARFYGGAGSNTPSFYAAPTNDLVPDGPSLLLLTGGLTPLVGWLALRRRAQRGRGTTAR